MRDGTGLIVDDEPQIRRVVKNALEGEVARVVEAATGSEGIDLAAAEKPSVIVLDLGLPDMPGIEVCREIRKWSTAPILILSARHADQEKALLLDAGADDYITKPFSTLELTARIRAHLRRSQNAQASLGPPQPLALGDLAVDLAARTVRRDGEPVHLTPIEWELLRTLLTQAGRTLTHRQLFNAVWGRSFGDPQQYLRVHVANLRRKIEQDAVRPRLILTEPGVGYRLELPR
ncbi:MAG: two-component system, OmpR family, operon response regulator KdpE [Acidobacteriota bacterium]|jgi:two-component system KDP operon response regulator KdpE|nr:two-component system, OmpR family, operon response regulator KdpE [Acidobacteriota bacterium]